MKSHVMLRMGDKNICRWAVSLGLMVGSIAPVAAETSVDIHFVSIPIERSSSLSEIEMFPEDLGRAGADLALNDSKKILKFLKKELALHYHSRLDDLPQSAGIIVLDAPQDAIEQALARHPESLIVNASNPATGLRKKLCQHNLLHSIPSWRMYSDALSQFLVSKRWNRAMVIHGMSSQDVEYLSALQESFKRFNIRAVKTESWDFDADLRRAASEEIPVLTRTDDHDVVVVVDTNFNFGHVIPFNTDRPRPVVGTHGLKPLAWYWRMEQWGATQIQKRFVKLSGRRMEASDYGVWLGIRAVVEAFVQTDSHDPRVLQNYLLSDQFEVAGFKGRKISVRSWNGQFRQPIPLAHEDGLVALAPLKGFIHRVTDLDTLGYDQREVLCGM